MPTACPELDRTLAGVFTLLRGGVCCKVSLGLAAAAANGLGAAAGDVLGTGLRRDSSLSSSSSSEIGGATAFLAGNGDVPGLRSAVFEAESVCRPHNPPQKDAQKNERERERERERRERREKRGREKHHPSALLCPLSRHTCFESRASNTPTHLRCTNTFSTVQGTVRGIGEGPWV